MKTNLERIDEMKNKKGFTLIELLAVIVILAIIALIAVPTVMNIISRANKSAFKDSAYGILKAGELYYTDKLLEAQGMSEDKIFTFPNNIEGLEINGSKPTGGSMVVNKKGQISMAIHNGRHCVKKGFEDDDVTITDDIENCKLSGYSIGDVVYYNPVEDKICTDYVEANSATGVKEGCMRWYVYAIDGRKAKLILDHNTTGGVAWISSDDYYDAGGTNFISGQYVGKNDKGPITLINQLKEDTKEWHENVEADVITYEELSNLLPYYQKLSSSEQQAWLDDDWDIGMEFEDEISAAWADVNENIPFEDDSEIFKAQYEYFVANYSELALPKYMYEDIIETCENVGNEEDGYYAYCPTYGYWTRTANINTPNSAWAVVNYFSNGSFSIPHMSVPSDDIGLRPVITLSK